MNELHRRKTRHIQAIMEHIHGAYTKESHMYKTTASSLLNLNARTLSDMQIMILSKSLDIDPVNE
jgi:hypothetical protein